MKTFYQISPTNHGWGYGYGFFSNYRICLEQLIHHYNIDDKRIPYINWDKTTWIEGFNPFETTNFTQSYNPFDFWFDQIIPTQYDTIDICKSKPRPDLIDHSKDYFNEPVHSKKQQLVDRLNIKPKKHILNKIEEIYKKEFEGHVVLGIVARGSEYNFHHPMYGVFGIQDYLNEIEKILTINPNITKLFIVSEESSYVEDIHNKFPPSFFLKGVFRRTDESLDYINKIHCWPNVSTKRENQCQLLGEETIIQTKLLAKCDYLFGRFSGVFAGSILWNENIKQIFTIK